MKYVSNFIVRIILLFIPIDKKIQNINLIYFSIFVGPSKNQNNL